MAEEVIELIHSCCPDPSPLQFEAEFLSWRECLKTVISCDPLTCDNEDLVHFTTSLPADCDRDMRLDYLFATEVQPAFPDNRLTVVHGYPASQAALARLDPADERIAERFEVFWGSTELANGYRELTCPREQRQRFIRDNQRRRQLGRPSMPMDEQLLAALDAGLPECSGVALGLERLLMIATGTDDISQVTAF